LDIPEMSALSLHDALPIFLCGPHLRDEVQEEQQRTIAHAWQARTEAAVEALLLGLAPDLALDLLPLHAERRVRQHVVEVLPWQADRKSTRLNSSHVKISYA